MSKGKSNGSGDAVMAAVLQVAKTVVKSLKDFKGVGVMKTDLESRRVTVAVAVAVAGEKVDLRKLRDVVAAEMNRKVELLSPAKSKPGPVKKKTNEVTKVVLKVELHCHCYCLGCIDKIRRHIRDIIKGVEKVKVKVKVDAERNQITVLGTMDGKALPAIFEEKLNLEAKVLAPNRMKTVTWAKNV